MSSVLVALQNGPLVLFFLKSVEYTKAVDEVVLALQFQLVTGADETYSQSTKSHKMGFCVFIPLINFNNLKNEICLRNRKIFNL